MSVFIARSSRKWPAPLISVRFSCYYFARRGRFVAGGQVLRPLLTRHGRGRGRPANPMAGRHISNCLIFVTHADDPSAVPSTPPPSASSIISTMAALLLHPAGGHKSAIVNKTRKNRCVYIYERVSPLIYPTRSFVCESLLIHSFAPSLYSWRTLTFAF